MSARPSRTDLETVRTLLAAAGLELPADELTEVAASYPSLRARLDAAHAMDLPEGTTPDLALRPRRPAPRRPR